MDTCPPTPVTFETPAGIVPSAESGVGVMTKSDVIPTLVITTDNCSGTVLQPYLVHNGMLLHNGVYHYNALS